jgi:Family of unknown function (DUF5994)
MTSQPHARRDARRFAVHATYDKNHPYGAWWPRNRTLADHLDDLFASWPPHAGRIVRVLYSPPDWDDRPRSVAASGRRVKTGSFPRDDSHQLQLRIGDGVRRAITVIPPATEARVAHDILTAVAADGRVDASRAEQAVWDDESGLRERPISSGTSAHAVA